MNSITLEIPRTPPSYSQIIRMKVKDRIQMKKMWRQEIQVAVIETVDVANFIRGFKVIRIIQHRKRLIRDPDNLWASVKPILDALKHNALIIDDDFKNIDLISVAQCKATEEVKTVIIVSDPEDKE